MFHRFLRTVRSVVVSCIAVAIWQPAAAEIYTFEGTMTFCTGICSSFAALGAPTGGVANMTPSDVSGFIEIDVAPNGSFTEADIVDYSFEIFNSAVDEVAAVFTGETFDNPTLANPLPLDDRVVSFDFVPGFDNFPTMIFGGSGTTGPNNELTSGLLVATFTVPPFNPNGAQVYFDLGGGPTVGWLFGGVVQFTEIDSVISQLPGEISVVDNPTAFPATAIGESAAVDITVTNTGGGPLTIVSVATVDTLAAPFSITDDGCTGVIVAAAGSCVIEGTFAPSTAGDFADSFDIVSDDPDTPSTIVSLTGTGLEPNIQVTPFPLAFAATAIGDTSQATAIVTNTGLAPLILGMIDFTMLDPQITVALDNCSLLTLAASETCDLTMEFGPTSEGFVTSDIVFPSNDPDLPFLNYEVEGTGIIGTIADIGVAPTTLAFEEILLGDMSELAALVSSTGNDPLEISSISITGTDAAEFSEDNDCPASLDSGSNCTVNVVFEPLSGGDKTAALTIVSNGDSAPTLDVPISASAFDGPRIQVDPTALDLGSPGSPVDIGTSATADVTVSNIGTSDLTVGTLSIVDDTRGGVTSTEFTVDTNGCTTPVAPLGSCMITVGFSPLTDADKAALLIIQSDDVDNPSSTVTLTGYVFRGARVDVPDTTIDIDGGSGVEIGQTTNFDLVITNSGTEDLEITGFALGGDDADDFSFTETCVVAPVAPQGTCTVTIGFMPLVAGEKSAELSIFSNDVTLVRAPTIVVTLLATATAPPPPPPPAPPGSQTVQPPAFALADPGGGTLGLGLLGLGLVLLLARRRYR